MRVCIDAGHGGTDPGAVADGRQEKESNLRVALKVEALLRRQGIDVLMTRREDRAVSLPERCRMANEWGADVFVSLHADAAGVPTVRGHHAIRSIHARPGEGGDRLGRLIVDEFARATGRQPLSRGDRGVWSRALEADPSRDYYAVIRGTRMPAVIFERGFVTNPDDQRLLYDDDDLARQAEGIAKGICAYFGLNDSTRRVNIAYAQAEDIDVTVPPAWARLSEIYAIIAPQPARISNANLFAPTKVLGLVVSGGKVRMTDPWACWRWPVLAVYADGRARVLPEGWRSSDIPGIRCAVAGAPLLVRGGQVKDVWAAMRDAGIDASIRPDDRVPRTAVGVTADGLVVHAISEAATLAEMARALLDAGAVDALALDGGGSTGLIEGGRLVMGHDDRRLPCALVLRRVVERNKERMDTTTAPVSVSASTVVAPVTVVVWRSGSRTTVAGEVRSGMTWAPIRPVAEALGARVEWDEASKTVMVR